MKDPFQKIFLPLTEEVATDTIRFRLGEKDLSIGFQIEFSRLGLIPERIVRVLNSLIPNTLFDLSVCAREFFFERSVLDQSKFVVARDFF